MYYLIGRDLDADGSYEFIKDMETMILTEDPSSALQMTEEQLAYLDMPYLNEAGFYALEADRFQVSILEQLLFSPMVMGFRPPMPPPRRRRRPAPRPHHRRPPHRPHSMAAALGFLDALVDHRPAKPRRHGPKPKPRPAGPKHRPKPRASGPRPGGAGRGPARGRGPGGRGPGR